MHKKKTGRMLDTSAGERQGVMTTHNRTTRQAEFATELRAHLVTLGWQESSIAFLTSKTEAEIKAKLGPRFLIRLRRERPGFTKKCGQRAERNKP